MKNAKKSVLILVLLMILSSCATTLHVFYYKAPDNPQTMADIRDCQRTSLMSDVEQWAIMGSCLDTVSNVAWYYGTMKEQTCYNARNDGDMVGLILYDCFTHGKDTEKLKGTGTNGNKEGIALYNSMIEKIKSMGGQKYKSTKSK
ncbi:MAG: hypothetical protein ACP5T7_07465 [bacterium]